MLCYNWTWSLMKKLIKSVKKLRLWSRKITKKHEENNYEHPPPPPPCHHCCCCSSSSTQPSAPPLPSTLSWVEQHNNYGTFLMPPKDIMCFPSQAQDIAVSVSSSEPVYGIPVRTDRSSICQFQFAAYLFRCLCPCFHIRQLVWISHSSCMLWFPFFSIRLVYCKHI